MSRKKTEKDKKVWISTLIQMVAIVVIVLLLRTFVIGTIYVKGSSMEPNFHHGDFLVINKLETRVASPQVNDIVICKLDNVEYQENIIKRVIGLPGDEIDLRNNGSGIYHLYIMGRWWRSLILQNLCRIKGTSPIHLLCLRTVILLWGIIEMPAQTAADSPLAP